MKKINLIGALLLCLLSTTGIAQTVFSITQTVYCWTNGKKQYLTVDQNQSIIRLNDRKANATDLISKFATTNLKATATYVGGFPAVVVQHPTPKATADFLAQVKQAEAMIDYVLPVYYDSEWQTYYATNEIVLGLQKDVTIEQVIQTYKGAVTLKENTPWNMYLLRATDARQVFDIANKIYESGVAIYANPNFRADLKLSTAPTTTQAVYCWTNGEKHYLTADPSQSIIRLNDKKANAAEFGKQLATNANITTEATYIGGFPAVVVQHTSPKAIADFLAQTKQAQPAIDYVLPVYKDSEGKQHFATNEISVGLQKGTTIEQVIETYKGTVTLKESTPWNMYLLRVTDATQVFEIANKIYESGVATYSNPNFRADLKLSEGDPLELLQWHLNTRVAGNYDLNANEAWALTKNCENTPVVIGMVDDGLDPHEDLVMVQGYTPLDPTGFGACRPEQELSRQIIGHGIACAGVAGARHNKVGMKGVANNVTFVPVNIWTYQGETNFDAAKGINWAWDDGKADILNFSWGRTESAPGGNEVRNAVQNALTQGRNGLGTVVVGASGNGSSTVDFPANINGVITVGGILRDGGYYQLSGRGASMDVVAFAESFVATTDRMGGRGYSSMSHRYPDYTIGTFAGTSAAAPQVSGIAALMLQTNPDLTASQVLQYIQESAMEIPIKDPNPGFDTLFGYGRVDARRAVERVLKGKVPTIPLGGFDNWLNSLIQSSSNTTDFCNGDLLRFTAPELSAAGIIPRWRVSSQLEIVGSSQTHELVVRVVAAGTARVELDFALFKCTYTSSRELTSSAAPTPSPVSFEICNQQYREFFIPLTGNAARYTWTNLSTAMELFTNVTGANNGTRIGLLATEVGIKYLLRTSYAANGTCTSQDTVVVNVLDCGIGTCRVVITYPNPTTSDFQLRIISPDYRCVTCLPIDPTPAPCRMENGTFTYQLRNFFAQTVQTGQLTDNTTQTINVSSLKEGNYWLQVYFNGELLHSQQVSIVK